MSKAHQFNSKQFWETINSSLRLVLLDWPPSQLRGGLCCSLQLATRNAKSCWVLDIFLVLKFPKIMRTHTHTTGTCNILQVWCLEMFVEVRFIKGFACAVAQPRSRSKLHCHKSKIGYWTLQSFQAHILTSSELCCLACMHKGSQRVKLFLNYRSSQLNETFLSFY